MKNWFYRFQHYAFSISYTQTGADFSSLRFAIFRRDFSEVELSPSFPSGEVTQPLLAVSGKHRQECLCHAREKAHAAIRAGGDELNLIGAANAVVEARDAGEYTLGDVGARENVQEPEGGRAVEGV